MIIWSFEIKATALDSDLRTPPREYKASTAADELEFERFKLGKRRLAEELCREITEKLFDEINFEGL